MSRLDRWLSRHGVFFCAGIIGFEIYDLLDVMVAGKWMIASITAFCLCLWYGNFRLFRKLYLMDLADEMERRHDEFDWRHKKL